MLGKTEVRRRRGRQRKRWLDGREFEQAPGDGEGQGNLVCFSLWGRKGLDMTDQLNNKLRMYENVYFLMVIPNTVSF